MEIAAQYKKNENEALNQKIGGFVEAFFKDTDEAFKKVDGHIWRLFGEDYEFNLIVTSKLIIMDAELCGLPSRGQGEFVLELLKLNGHQTKACKFCMVKSKVRLRIINEHVFYTNEIFKVNLEEFVWQFPRLRDLLAQKFFANTK